MGPISLDITIDAPRERVFDAICDLSRRPSWAGSIVSDYRLERLEPVGKGAAARFRADAPGGIQWMETVITEADRPHRVVEGGRGGHLDRVPARAVWDLSGSEGTPTELRLTFATEPKAVFDKLREAGRAGRWWRRRWNRSLRALRDQLESSDPAPEPVAVAGIDSRP